MEDRRPGFGFLVGCRPDLRIWDRRAIGETIFPLRVSVFSFIVKRLTEESLVHRHIHESECQNPEGHLVNVSNPGLQYRPTRSAY